MSQDVAFISNTNYQSMWGVLCRILSVLKNIVMDMNFVMNIIHISMSIALAKVGYIAHVVGFNEVQCLMVDDGTSEDAWRLVT
jgi:hypothetical protein